jgi:cysteinyl-tRNA synthetase
MDEDFNTPRALATLFDLSKEINKFLDEQEQVSRKLLDKAYSDFSELGKVLGLFQRKKSRDIGEKITDDLVKLLFDLREELRQKGEYGLSDEVRARMRKLGLVIEDTTEGPKWKIS